jgi:hypothetical protein
MPPTILRTTLLILLAAITPIFAIAPKNLVIFGDSYSGMEADAVASQFFAILSVFSY